VLLKKAVLQITEASIIFKVVNRGNDIKFVVYLKFDHRVGH
jgi:hypothetical protein